jgi:hypothetical protein
VTATTAAVAWGDGLTSGKDHMRVRRSGVSAASWGMALLALATLAGGCGGETTGSGSGGTGTPTTAGAGASGRTVKVPQDQPTVQAAVDAAQPGDLVLISPGVYKEAVNVTKENLTIRGLERNTTILDGEFTRENGVRVLNANGVSVENMTARNFTGNGFFWTGVTGYRGSYLTTSRTGNYGVYAFDSTKGQFDHLYTSGSPDAGIYIGQCYLCDAVITDSVSEYNGLGYSGTNSGGNLYIVNSTFRFNRAGIVPNSGSYELCYPERETTIAGNLVYSNNQGDTPAIDVALLAMGNGILAAGGRDNTITHNRVWDHERTGIGLVPFPETDAVDNIPPEDAMKTPCAEAKNKPPTDPAQVKNPVFWPAKNNKVTDNTVERSGVADIAVGTLGDDTVASLGNCFSGNTVSTSAPKDLQGMSPCGGKGNGADPANGALDLGALMAAARPPKGDYKTQPVPPDQPNMPDAATAPARPATDVPMKVDLSTIKTPAAPAT